MLIQSDAPKQDVSHALTGRGLFCANTSGRRQTPRYPRLWGGSLPSSPQSTALSRAPASTQHVTSRLASSTHWAAGARVPSRTGGSIASGHSLASFWAGVYARCSTIVPTHKKGVEQVASSRYVNGRGELEGSARAASAPRTKGGGSACWPIASPLPPLPPARPGHPPHLRPQLMSTTPLQQTALREPSHIEIYDWLCK